MSQEQITMLSRENQTLITIDEIKHYLRIESDNNDDDEMLVSIIEAAVQAAEKYLGFYLNLCEVEQLQQDFYGGIVELKYRPVVELKQVFTWQDNVRKLLDKGLYYFDLRLARVELRTPLIGGNIGIVYKAGYDNHGLIDAPIKLGILNHIASLYDDRHLATLPRASIVLYAPYRRMRLT